MLFLKTAKFLHWTFHARNKMRQYGLSEARVKRILHAPTRIEKGIALQTVALMQSAGSKKHPYELWVMIQDKKDCRNLISAWRYPGQTKPRSETLLNLMKQVYEEYSADEKI